MSGSYADLSLSELSLNDKPIAGPSKQPFSLLARPSLATSPHEEVVDVQDEQDEEQSDEVEGRDRNGDEEAGDDAEEATHRVESKRSVAHNRDERLRQDLFVLRKLNSVFSTYNEALGDVQSGSEVSA